MTMVGGLTVRELADRFGLPLSVIYKGLNDGRIALIPVTDKPRIYALNDIIEWENNDPKILWESRHVVDGQRRCVKCGNRFKKTTNGRTCKSCLQKPNKQYRSRNLNACRNRTIISRRKRMLDIRGRSEIMLNMIRSRFIDSDIDLEFVMSRLLIGFCEKTYIPFSLETDGAINPWGPSIDRIDNSGTYSKNNVQIVCNMYNIGKNRHNELDFIAMCMAVAECNVSNEAAIERLKGLRNAGL